MWLVYIHLARVCLFARSTIGYGATPDGVPADPSLLPGWYRPFLTFQIVLSVSTLAGLVSHMSRLKGQRAAQLQQAELQRLRLTERLIEQFDRNGDGVDKLEFVVGMLSHLGLVYWHDVKPLLELFDSFDR